MSNYPQNTEHPQSYGALFVNNDKQKQNHPDMRGNIDVSPDQIRRLIEMSKAGLEPKLQVAGWWKTANSGATYLSLKNEAYMKAEQPQPPQYPPQQQYGGAPAGYAQPQAAPPQGMPPQAAPQQQMPVPPVPQVPQAAPPAMSQPAQPAPANFPDDDIPFR